MLKLEVLNPIAKGLLRYTVLQYMLDMLCENPKLGSVFVDEEENPKTCFVRFHHLLFVGGEITEESLEFLKNNIFSQKGINNPRDIIMMYPNEAWKAQIKSMLPNKCYDYKRSLYKWKNKSIDNIKPCENIKQITTELMNTDTDNLDMIIEEVMSTGTYDSMEDYLGRGIGFTPVFNNRVCGFCTSEYPSRNSIAIGIEVLEEYQHKGNAKAMTEAFIQKASKQNLNIYWECWKDNVASYKTALSCGFDKVDDYPILYLQLSKLL